MARGRERDSSRPEPGQGPRKAQGPGTEIGSRSNGPGEDIGPETRLRESRGRETDRETPDCADPGHGHQRLARTRIKPWATDRAEDTTMAKIGQGQKQGSLDQFRALQIGQSKAKSGSKQTL